MDKRLEMDESSDYNKPIASEESTGPGNGRYFSEYERHEANGGSSAEIRHEEPSPDKWQKAADMIGTLSTDNAYAPR